MKKILIVEDDLQLLKMYSFSFSEASYIVDQAINGKEALKKIKENEYAVILLDIMLPKINGIEVLKEIKNDPKLKNLPVVAVTNLGEEDFSEEATKLGVRAVLVKNDYTPHDVVTKVKEIIEK